MKYKAFLFDEKEKPGNLPCGTYSIESEYLLDRILIATREVEGFRERFFQREYVLHSHKKNAQGEVFAARYLFKEETELRMFC